MATQPVTNDHNMTATAAITFARFAGVCALMTGVVGLLYAISFIVLRNTLLSSLFLMLGGLLSLGVLSAVYQRFTEKYPAFARWAFLLSVAGAAGALIHGGYDLANALHPQALTAAEAGLPNAIDPRGLLTFGIAGLALFLIAWLIGRDSSFPRALSYWGYVTGVLLVGLYLSRLILLDPTMPLIVFLALVSGFVLNPIWYIWLGITLMRR